MKKLIILTILLAGIFTCSTVNAQVRININIGSQPLWGPAGYSHADYYYLPDVEAYYNVPQRQFIYMDRSRWVTATALPARYGRYNLYTMYKVVVNNPNPYLNHKYYRKQYAGYKGRYGQQVIRDSRDTRYAVVKGHPLYNTRNNHTTVINNTTVINRTNNNGYQANNNGRHKGWDKRKGRR